MSLGHCYHHTRRIGKLPHTAWAGEIAKLPDSCTHTDCGDPKNCRQRISEYMRVQWQINPPRRSV